MSYFTIHLRLSKRCNAHCSYCSTDINDNHRITLNQLEESLNFITHEIFPKIGVKRNFTISVEFLGGEVLALPLDYLEKAVQITRNAIKPFARIYIDGVQTNLIGSAHKISKIAAIFNRNIGTSWDPVTNKRQIAGSAEIYRAVFNKSINYLEKELNLTPGRVVVIDRDTASSIPDLIKTARKEKFRLVLRPVFLGASSDVDHNELSTLLTAMHEGYREWSKDKEHEVEPYSRFHNSLLPIKGKTNNTGYCPFQADCTFRSISIDPDGAIYVCQEMADSKNFLLGNAINKEFDNHTWLRLSRRSFHLSHECKSCEFIHECGGGCMNEAINQHGDPFAKTEFCPIWKSLLRVIKSEMDNGIE